MTESALNQRADVLAKEVRKHKKAHRFHRNRYQEAAQGLVQLKAMAAKLGIKLIIEGVEVKEEEELHGRKHTQAHINRRATPESHFPVR